jgi:hypothetical protein
MYRMAARPGAAVTLGALRVGRAVSGKALTKAMGLGAQALRKLESTPLARVSVGALLAYAGALGARVEVVFDDGHRVEVKP